MALSAAAVSSITAWVAIASLATGLAGTGYSIAASEQASRQAREMNEQQEQITAEQQKLQQEQLVQQKRAIGAMSPFPIR